jgi:hypothetical protein
MPNCNRPARVAHPNNLSVARKHLDPYLETAASGSKASSSFSERRTMKNEYNLALFTGKTSNGQSQIPPGDFACKVVNTCSSLFLWPLLILICLQLDNWQAQHVPTRIVRICIPDLGCSFFLLLKLDLHDAHADFRSLIRVAGIRCQLQCK